MLTAHYMVKNEEYYIKPSILSVLPFVEKLIIFDTGSTDKTVEKIKSIKSDKIEFFSEKVSDPKKLIDVRNKMIFLTKSEFFIVVDGDEVYDISSVKIILKLLNSVKKNIHRIELMRFDFVKNFNFVSRKQYVGKIYRTNKIAFAGVYPFEGPVLKNNPKANVFDFSQRFPETVNCFHFGLLERSSKDFDVMVGRGWRKTPFPVFPFFKKMPETLSFSKNSFFLLLPFELVFLNVKGFFTRRTKDSV